MKSILLIDNDELTLFGLAKAISNVAKEAEVLTARHGVQAVEILTSHPVDLIVTDLKVPVMNGYELVDYANRNFPCIPVYVMTRDYLPDVKTRFRSSAVTEFVSKPFSFRQVAAGISNRLEAVAV